MDKWPWQLETVRQMISCVFTDLLLLLLFHVWLFAITWIVASQAPLTMGFPRQEYCSGLPFPSPGHLPNPGIEPSSPALAGGFFTTSATWEVHSSFKIYWVTKLELESRYFFVFFPHRKITGTTGKRFLVLLKLWHLPHLSWIMENMWASLVAQMVRCLPAM